MTSRFVQSDYKYVLLSSLDTQKSFVRWKSVEMVSIVFKGSLQRFYITVNQGSCVCFFYLPTSVRASFLEGGS